MKRVFAILTVLALVFALASCADSETPTDPSKTSTEASSTSGTTGTPPHIDDIHGLNIPSLAVYCGDSTLNVQWHSGSWHEKGPDGKMSAINADSVHPKDVVSLLPRFALPSFEGKTATLSFYPKPNKVEVTSYPIGKDGKVSDKTKPTSFTLTGDLTFPIADKTLYDIVGTWNDPDCGGTVCYAFVTDSAFLALDYAKKVLYEKYPALKNLDSFALSVHQNYSKESEYSFTFHICFDGIKTSESYSVTLKEDGQSYTLNRCSDINEGEYSAFYALATPEKLAKAKEDILSQIGDYEYEPCFYFTVKDNKLLMQAECIFDIVTPQSLLGQGGCGISHEHVYYTATVCEK